MSKIVIETGLPVQRYGAFVVGYLGALGAMVAAYFMPASAATLISSAGTLAVLTFFFTGVNNRFGVRLLGMIAAGVTLVFAYLMPDHANDLLGTSGTIAVLSLIFA